MQQEQGEVASEPKADRQADYKKMAITPLTFLGIMELVIADVGWRLASWSHHQLSANTSAK